MSDDLMKEAKQLLNSHFIENTKWFKLGEPVSKPIKSQFKPNVYYYHYGSYPDYSSTITINNEEYQVLHHRYINVKSFLFNLPNKLVLIIKSYI